MAQPHHYDQPDAPPPARTVGPAQLERRGLGTKALLGVDGISDLNGLHSRRHDAEVEFYAFDMLVSDGEDLRKLPLTMRKTNLARLLARRVDGIHLAPFEQGEIGPDLFRHPV